MISTLTAEYLLPTATATAGQLNAHSCLTSDNRQCGVNLTSEKCFRGKGLVYKAIFRGPSESKQLVKRRVASRCEAVDGSVSVAEKEAPQKVEDGAPAAAPEVPIEFKYDPYPTILDINQIRDILPHRFPFLLVDRVIEFNPGVSAVAIKNVTINDNFFPGHFPERPIMPGVLMVEAMAQVGGIVMLNPEVGGSKENFFFAGVDKVRFRKPVIAGDTLVMRMTLTKLQKRFGIAKMEGKAYVGKDLVCEGEFMMALG